MILLRNGGLAASPPVRYTLETAEDTRPDPGTLMQGRNQFGEGWRNRDIIRSDTRFPAVRMPLSPGGLKRT